MNDLEGKLRRILDDLESKAEAIRTVLRLVEGTNGRQPEAAPPAPGVGARPVHERQRSVTS